MTFPIRNWLTPPGNNARFLHKKKRRSILILTSTCWQEINFLFQTPLNWPLSFHRSKRSAASTLFFGGFRKFQRFHCLPTRSKSRDASWLGGFLFTYVCWLFNRNGHVRKNKTAQSRHVTFLCYKPDNDMEASVIQDTCGVTAASCTSTVYAYRTVDFHLFLVFFLLFSPSRRSWYARAYIVRVWSMGANALAIMHMTFGSYFTFQNWKQSRSIYYQGTLKFLDITLSSFIEMGILLNSYPNHQSRFIPGCDVVAFLGKPQELRALHGNVRL